MDKQIFELVKDREGEQRWDREREQRWDGDGEQRWDGDGEQRWDGEGVEWNRVVRDPLAIQYLTVSNRCIISWQFSKDTCTNFQR